MIIETSVTKEGGHLVRRAVVELDGEHIVLCSFAGGTVEAYNITDDGLEFEAYLASSPFVVNVVEPQSRLQALLAAWDDSFGAPR